MNSKFEQVKDLFNDRRLFIQHEFLTSNDLPIQEFNELFPVDEYQSSRFQVSTNEGTVCIDDLDFVFEDYHELFTKVASDDSEVVSPEVIIVSSGAEFIQLGDFSKFYRLWVNLIEKVSDHSYPVGSPGTSKAYIFVNKSSINSSTVLNVEIDQVSREQLEKLSTLISNPILLLDSCLQEDAHQGEKLSMMKASIVEMIEENDFTFVDLFISAESLLDNFHKNYETYLRSFSFEEFIKDLEEDVGDFISKVEEQIQGFYIQALAVPGAVILASAFRGAEKNISLALIFSTALALILVFRSLKSKTIFIERITQNTFTKLSIYERRTFDIANSFAKESISEKIGAAISSVGETSEQSKSEIEKIRDIIIALIVLYVISAIVFWKM